MSIKYANVFEKLFFRQEYSRRDILKLAGKGLVLFSIPFGLADCALYRAPLREVSWKKEYKAAIKDSINDWGLPDRTYLYRDYFMFQWNTHIGKTKARYRYKDGSYVYSYNLIKPEQVRDEVKKINFYKKYHPDPNINKVISIINYIRRNFDYIRSSPRYPYESLKDRRVTCTSATALGLSMMIAAGIDKRGVFYARGKIYRSRKRYGHAWGAWEYKGKTYLLEFIGNERICSLPEVSEKLGEYFPFEYCSTEEVNRLKAFCYRKRKKHFIAGANAPSIGPSR